MSHLTSQPPPPPPPPPSPPPRPAHRAPHQAVGLFGTLLRSTAWLSGTRLGVRVLGLVNTAIVARLLLPEDYGVVALGMSVWALLEAFTTFDTDSYIVRAKTATHAMFDAAWTMNVATASLLAAGIALAAPALALFLEDQRLVDVFYIIAGIIFVNGLKNPAFLIFNRRQDFSRESFVQLSGKALSVAVTIYFAYTLRSFYALIIGIAFSHAWRALGTYALRPYLPRFHVRGLRDIFHFSAWLTAARALSSLSTRFDSIILQKMLGPTAVGLFSVSKETAQLIDEQLVMPVRRAMLPTMGRMQDDIDEMRRLY
ncbi:MAG: hypothetical protein D6782_04355, partial [Alphaproteobacteria bacterium]